MEENIPSNQPPIYGQPPISPINNQFGHGQLPNSTAVLVLGILSIALCFCYGIVGLVLGIIALVLASKGADIYAANPGAYSLASYNNLKAGRICAIIGVILSVLYILFLIIYVVFIGAALTSMPWDLKGMGS